VDGRANGKENSLLRAGPVISLTRRRNAFAAELGWFDIFALVGELMMPMGRGYCMVMGLSVCMAALALSNDAFAQANAVEIGYIDLINRLGGVGIPTGAGVVLTQVEASESAGNFGPNTAFSEFVGKTFTPQSGPFGNSGHATDVGLFAYGNSSSVAPGITSIQVYEAGHWAQSGFLRVGQGAGAPPLAPANQTKIINNSWAATFGSAALDNEALRRADFEVDRDDTIMINPPVNNFQPEQSLMGNTFNAITVGLTSGTHLPGPVPSTLDGPGRQRPNIVAPGQFTSYAAPVVSATAALMVQTACTFPGLLANPNAQRSETIKAVILGGGRKRAGWTNNTPTSGPNRGLTTTPLNAASGVDVVNVNNSHFILTGLEQNGSASVPGAINATSRGWDLGSITNTGSLHYRFAITGMTDELSLLCTWHRNVTGFTGSPGYTLANFNMELFRVNCSNQLVPLTGDANASIFTGGNVSSQSGIENVEHLYIRNLKPGNYVLRVNRSDGMAQAWDVGVAWLIPAATTDPSDIDVNGVTNVQDLLAVIAAWGACPGICPTDIAPPGGDCTINVQDLLAVIAGWG